jgi:group I intron endonuclease
MIVYKITNKINGKMYIGQTISSIEERWAGHCYNSSRCTRMKNAINKYGKENFSIEVIEICSTQEELDEKETFYIKQLNTLSPNGYNLKLEGKGKGMYSEEAKLRISAGLTGKKQSPEQVEKRASKCRGQKRRPATEAEKERIRICNTGRKRSDEFKKRRSQIATEQNKKRVINTETGEIVNSVKELALKLDKVYSTLVNWLNGNNPNPTTWEYITTTTH